MRNTVIFGDPSMTEAEVLAEISTRTEAIWSLLQWWVSLSFAVMVGAYWGAQRLTVGITILICSLYSLSTLVVFSGMTNFSLAVRDGIETLRILSLDPGLSPIGEGALGRQSSLVVVFTQVWVVASFLFTNAFVIYCYKRVREAPRIT